MPCHAMLRYAMLCYAMPCTWQNAGPGRLRPQGAQPRRAGGLLQVPGPLRRRQRGGILRSSWSRPDAVNLFRHPMKIILVGNRVCLRLFPSHVPESAWHGCHGLVDFIVLVKWSEGRGRCTRPGVSACLSNYACSRFSGRAGLLRSPGFAKRIRS